MKAVSAAVVGVWKAERSPNVSVLNSKDDD